MKIYFTYRSAYEPNTRHLKEFEAESILDWFQQNWQILASEDSYTSDASEKLLGKRVYGIPAWEDDEGNYPKKPENFKELLATIEKHFYNNETRGDQNCIKVDTDDDEIGLAWSIFTEKYKNENPEEVEIWFHKELPTDFSETGQKLEVEKEILPKGNKNGCLYYFSNPIYDGANLEDLEGVHKIENIRLPDFLDYLKSIYSENEETENSVSNEIGYLQYLAKNSESTDLKEVFKLFTQLPITDFDWMENYKKTPFKELTKNLSECEKSRINLTEHFCEISVNTMDIFHDYYLIFDDLWVEKHPLLAKSILKFGECNE